MMTGLAMSAGTPARWREQEDEQCGGDPLWSPTEEGERDGQFGY